MKQNIRFRNRQINTVVGMFVVTVFASIAAISILKVALEVPFSAFATSYDIGDTQ